jgi:fibronectin-binding autotransporter adhesin
VLRAVRRVIPNPIHPMRIPTKTPTTRAALAATATHNSRWFASFIAGATVVAAPLAQAVDNLWTGATDNNWNDPTNWSLGRVPTNNNGATEGDTFDDAVINTLNNFPVIVADLAAPPRDIIVGLGTGNTGRVDQRAGIAANGGGNWSFIGRAGGTGTYNLADTSASGGALTGFGTGTGSLTIGGRLYVGGNAADQGGNGTLNINTSGTLSMGSDFAVGASGATGVANMDAGTLNTNGWSFIGKREAFDGGNGTMNLGGGTMNHLGSRTFVGLGNATGAFNISGGTYNALNAGDNNTQFIVGSNNLTAPAPATLSMTGGTLNAARLFTIGGTEAFGGDGNPDFINSGKGGATINGADALLNVTGEFWVAQGADSVGVLNLNAGTIQVDNWVAIGRRTSSTGTVNMSGGTFTKTGGGNFIVGDGGTGAIAQTGGALTVANGEFWVGQGGGTGTHTLSAGSLSVGNWFAVGRGGTGTFTQTGGTVTKTGGGGVSVGNFGGANGNLQVGGGLFDVQSGDLFAGEGGDGSGTITISGTGQVNAPVVRVGTNNTVVGTLDLDGGTLRAGLVDGGGGGTSNVDFNGTQIVATAHHEAFIANFDSAEVEAGGVKIDTNGMTLGIAQSLTDTGAGGGLTKTGTGTLNLNAFNTYTGATLVSEGTLGGTGTVSGAITVAEGADLNPGVSTGVLAADSVNFTGAATLTIDVDDTAPVAVDRLDVINSLNLTNASLVLNGELASKVYVIATYGTRTGTFSPAPTLPAGYSINYAYQGNKVALTRAATAFDAFIEAAFPEAGDDPAFLSPVADPDGDGTANSVEFALGGNPADPTDGPKVYPLTADSSDAGTANELLLTIAVLNGTPAFTGSPSPTATSAGYTYTVQGSTDLATFNTPVNVVTAVTAGLPAAPTGYTYRTFSLSGSDGLPSRGFLRVQVTP